MKRLILLVFLVCMLGLSGCAIKKVVVKVEMPTPPSELMEPPKPLKKIVQDSKGETPK